MRVAFNNTKSKMSSTSNKVNKYILAKINSYCLPITDPTHKQHPLALIFKQHLKEWEGWALFHHVEGENLLNKQRKKLMNPEYRDALRRGDARGMRCSEPEARVALRRHFGSTQFRIQKEWMYAWGGNESVAENFRALTNVVKRNQGMIEILWDKNVCVRLGEVETARRYCITVKELKQRCKMNGLTRYSHLRRVELIQALMRL